MDIKSNGTKQHYDKHHESTNPYENETFTLEEEVITITDNGDIVTERQEIGKATKEHDLTREEWKDFYRQAGLW